MIIAILGHQGSEARDRMVVILEPANIERLRHGEPIFKKLVELMTPQELAEAELIIDYCPDVEWLAAELEAGVDFRTAMNQAMRRPPVFRRGNVSEHMKRIL
jgi:hypothetical protein